MYKKQQLKYSNQNGSSSTSYNNYTSTPSPNNFTFRPNEIPVMRQETYANSLKAQNICEFQSPQKQSESASEMNYQGEKHCSPPPSLSNIIKAANNKQQCMISYLYCNKANHELNQLNMACLKQDCLNKGLICCLCLDDHQDHWKDCMAFQKIVTQLKGKIDRNSVYYDENLLSQTSDSQYFLTSIEKDYTDIQNVNSYLDILKLQYQKQHMESIDKINSLSSNVGNSLKDFFEKIEMNSIIGQSLNINPSTNLLGEINLFLQNIQMGADMKTIKLKIDSAMTKQSEELANYIKRQNKALSNQFQKYLKLIKNSQEQSASQSGIAQSSSGKESQLSSYSNSQHQNSTRKKRKNEKLLEKHAHILKRTSSQFNPLNSKPIQIQDSSESNSQKQNLDNAVLMSAPSQENNILTNYCLSFQDKIAFFNGKLSSSKCSEKKMGEFILSDYITHTSQSGTQSKKGSVEKFTSQYSNKQSNCQHTFGKSQSEIRMECEDEDLNDDLLSQVQNHSHKNIKQSKGFTIDSEESRNKQQSTQNQNSSRQVDSIQRNEQEEEEEDEEEEFEDEDEPYEDNMIDNNQGSNYSDYIDEDVDEEEENNDDGDQYNGQEIIQKKGRYLSNKNNKKQSNLKSYSQTQTNGGTSQNSKIEFSSNKKNQQMIEEIMSFQMPIRIEQNQDQIQFGQIQYENNNNNNNLFSNQGEYQRIVISSPCQNKSASTNSESPTFTRNLIDSALSKQQNKGNITQKIKCNEFNQYSNKGEKFNQFKTATNSSINSLDNQQKNSPMSIQGSTKATSSNILSPKSNKYSPCVSILINSPVRPVTRSSAKKQKQQIKSIHSSQNEAKNQLTSEEQKVGGTIQSVQQNFEQQNLYNDQIMYQDQSIQILEDPTQDAKMSNQKEEQLKTNSVKSPIQLNLNQNSDQKQNRARRMKRSSNSKIYDGIDVIKIENGSQQSSKNPSCQKQ